MIHNSMIASTLGGDHKGVSPVIFNWTYALMILTEQVDVHRKPDALTAAIFIHTIETQ